MVDSSRGTYESMKVISQDASLTIMAKELKNTKEGAFVLPSQT